MSIVRPFQRTALTRITHDGVIHHPLGGAGYYLQSFETHFLPWLNDHLPQQSVQIHVGAQPNSSPHMGNIAVFACAFALAEQLKAHTGKDVTVVFRPVDTAPSPGPNGQHTIDGVRYQRSLRFNGDVAGNNAVFNRMLAAFSGASGVRYTEKTLEESMVTAAMPGIMRAILADADALARTIAPGTNRLSIRSPCPTHDCGLADKAGVTTRYHADSIEFTCPHHGAYSVALDDLAQLARLEFNTPLRNLVRWLVDAQSDDGVLRVTGGDYAGFYQEQMTYRPLFANLNLPRDRVPCIAYKPPVQDWSGAPRAVARAGV